MKLRSTLTCLKFGITTFSAYALLGSCFHACASTADGQYVKANIAYSCVTPNESATLSRLFLDDGRYAEQWISKADPGVVSHLISGKWVAQFEPGKAEQITFSDNVRLDPRSNRQVVVPRAPEQVMPSKSDAKRVYFFDNNGRVQLMQCEESTVTGTKQMTTLANALWEDTKSTRVAESTRVTQEAKMSPSERADRDLAILFQRAGRTDLAEYRKLSKKERAERDLAQMIVQLSAMEASGSQRCMSYAGQMRRMQDQALGNYQQAESMANRPVAESLYAATSMYALNASATYKCP